MIIDDQIRDEKLQYDINREVAKISALSSGKIDKYEYLTGEEILPSNQQHIIEQAKFTCSPLGKVFEKQIKTTENQGEKQVEALKRLEPKAIDSKSNNKPSITKEIYNKILEERMDKVQEMSREIDFNNLIYHFKGPSPSISFNKFEGSMYSHDQLQNGNKTLSQVEEDKKNLDQS